MEDFDAGPFDRPEVLAVERWLHVALGKVARRADDLMKAKSDQTVGFANMSNGVNPVQDGKRRHRRAPNGAGGEDIVHAYDLLSDIKAHGKS